MRYDLLRPLTAVLATLTLALGLLPGAQAHLLVFKDGFVLQGTIKRGSQPLVDPSGAHFVVPTEGGFYTIDDGVRNVFISPGHIQDVIRDDHNRSFKPISLIGSTPRTVGMPLPSPWTIETAELWEKWTRHVVLDTVKGRFKIEQRVTLLTPQRVRVDAYRVDWIAYHLTRELGFATVRTLLSQYVAKAKESAQDKRLLICKFLLQAGYVEEAEKELKDLVQEYPDQKDKVEPLEKTAKEMQATAFIEGIERARQAGQYEEVRERLARFPKLGLSPYTTEKLLIEFQAQKNKQQEADDKLKNLQLYLKEFTQHIAADDRPLFVEATETIARELNLDTLPRLALFLGQAPAHQRDLQKGQKPAQRSEELLALAVSSWVLGGSSGDTNVATARQLWQTRKFLLEYLRTEAEPARKTMLESYLHTGPVGLDEIARMIPFLPPVAPYERLNTSPFRLEAEGPEGGKGGTYLVQLPPEYHHFRPYPVLIVLHQGDEKPQDMLNRWSDLAAQHGYILVAPEWNAGPGVVYNFSAREHGTVLKALRDLRRRFQVDSDRVFLFGYGQGGLMAYDVGLSHPDLFAGVLPMSAGPNFFAGKYGTNAQFLPFFVVSGDRTGSAATDNRYLFKEWVRWNYPSFYVEYKGRGVEWFGGELPTLLDWMGRKKRAHPLRDLGRVNFSGGAGEEFKTMRLTDNHFYWLEAEVQPRYVNNSTRWNSRAAAATLQANIFAGNQIHLRTTGINHVTVWLGPSMIDFTKPVALRVNNQQLAPMPVRASLETLLEDVYQRGDRQQLYIARVSVKT